MNFILSKLNLFGKSKQANGELYNKCETNYCETNYCETDVDTNLLMSYTTKDYVDFLNDKIPIQNGKKYSEISKYTDEEIENDQYFIEWIFPLTNSSNQFNCSHDIPIIDIDELQNYINEDQTIIDKLMKSLELMLKYWGINENNVETEKIIKLNGNDSLNFSRVLRSLIYHNKKGIAISVYDKVVNFIKDNYDVLNPLMYCGVCLNEMKPVGHLNELKNMDLSKLEKNIVYLDTWRYNLSKANSEFEKYTKKAQIETYSKIMK